MKRLKILFYLTMAFLLTVNVSLINKRVHAQDRLPGYSEWSTEKTGEEGEKSAVFYGYKEATGFSDQGSTTIPEDGFYNSSTQWKMTQYLNTVCSWDGRYGADSGIACWQEGAGWTSYKYSGVNVTYGDENTCSGVCRAEQITTYYPVTSWSEEKGWRTDAPYEKTNTIQPVSMTLYCHRLTFTISLDGEKEIKIKHGDTLPPVTVPTRPGYIFKGYFDDTGRQFYDANGYTSVVYEEGMATSLHARWEPISYTINYRTTYGSGYTPSQNVKYDESVTVLDSGYTYQGYKFVYWIDDYGKTYYPGSVLSNLTTTNNQIINFNAHFEKVGNVDTDTSKKEESKDSSSTTKKKISTDNSVVNKGDLDSEYYYLIRIPQELIINNEINNIDFEVKGKLKNGSNLKIQLPNTLYLKSVNSLDYEMNVNNIAPVKANELSENFKEIEISIDHPFNDNDKYTLSFPLIISVE